MKVHEVIDALAALERPNHPVVFQVVDDVEPGDMVPIDVVIRVGVAAGTVPDGEYAALRPIEDWIVGVD
jgi:hypothetical protein